MALRFTALMEVQDEVSGARVLLVDKSTVFPLLLPMMRCGDRVLVATSDGSGSEWCTVSEQTDRYVICDPVRCRVSA